MDKNKSFGQGNLDLAHQFRYFTRQFFSSDNLIIKKTKIGKLPTITLDLAWTLASLEL